MTSIAYTAVAVLVGWLLDRIASSQPEYRARRRKSPDLIFCAVAIVAAAWPATVLVAFVMTVWFSVRGSRP